MTGSTGEISTEEVVDRLLDWFTERLGAAALLEQVENGGREVRQTLRELVMAVTPADELLSWWLAKQNKTSVLGSIEADPKLRELILETIPSEEVVSMLVESRGAENALIVARGNTDIRDLLLAGMSDYDVVDGLSSVIDLEVEEWGGMEPFQIQGRYNGIPFYVRHRENNYSISIPDDMSVPNPNPVAGRQVYVENYDYDYSEEWVRQSGIKDPSLNRDLWAGTPSYLLNSLLTARAAIVRETQGPEASIARETQESEAASLDYLRKLRRTPPRRDRGRRLGIVD